MREHCGVNTISKSPQTIVQGLVGMLPIAGVIGILGAIPWILSEVGSVDLPWAHSAQRWSSVMYTGSSQTIWGFLGIAAAVIIALQLAVQDGGEGGGPRLLRRRQILAITAMFIGAFVLDALLLTALAPDPTTNLPLLFAAGGILVFMAAEAGSALVVPSPSAMNQEKIERYTKARAATAEANRHAGWEGTGSSPRLRFVRAYAFTASTCIVPTLLLWVFSGDLGSLLVGGLCVSVSAALQLAMVQTALFAGARGLGLEWRTLAGFVSVTIAIGLFGFVGAVMQVQFWQLAGAFLWSLVIAILSAVRLPRGWDLGRDISVQSAFGRVHHDWLGWRIERLRLKSLSAPVSTDAEIYAIRAWLADGLEVPDSVPAGTNS
jgi:hypothetical protein